MIWKLYLKEEERLRLDALDAQDAASRIERRRIRQRCWKRAKAHPHPETPDGQ